MIKKPLFIFFLFFYFIPGIFTLLFPSFINEEFNGEVGFISLLYSSIFFSLAYYSSNISFTIPRIKQLDILSILFSNKIELFFISIYLISSIIFFINFGLSFRQTGDEVSDVGLIIYINYISKSYIKVFLFKEIILASQKSYKSPFLKLALIIFSSILSASAALDAVVILMAIIIAFKRELIYETQKLSFSFYIILLLLLTLVPLLGTANKYGFERSFILISENGVYFFKALIRRIASWHQSINLYIDIIQNVIFIDALTLIKDIFKTFINRVEIIFGGEKVIPEVWSAARFNYLNLSVYTNNIRTGISPGIVASSLIFYFPIGLILFSFILGQYYKFIYNFFRIELNIFTNLFILLVIIFPLVSSPFDLINLLGNDFTLIFFLVSLGVFFKNSKIYR